MSQPSLPPLPLPEGQQSKYIKAGDITIHFVQANAPPPGTTNIEHEYPLIVLLHGFPEIAYSWRKVMTPLSKFPTEAGHGYHVVAPDMRGFGRTTGPTCAHPIGYESHDLFQFRIFNMAKDIVTFVYALGYTKVKMLVGHDFGSAVAAVCSLIRPDLFKSLVVMSAPVAGAPPLPFGVPTSDDLLESALEVRNEPTPYQKMDTLLASLNPPMKHYHYYFSTPQANEDMVHASPSLTAFYRAYYHAKSADWAEGSRPVPLTGWNPESVDKLPVYYVMPRGQTMPEAVAKCHPSKEELQAKSYRWLPEEELAVYVQEYGRIGFQGGLNLYRGRTTPSMLEDIAMFDRKKIEMPAMFIGGVMDWGVYQSPGAVDVMRAKCGKNMPDENFVLVEGAGHWVQQEQPEILLKEFHRFLSTVVNY